MQVHTNELREEPSYIAIRGDQFRRYVEATTTARNKAMGESMAIFKPAIFRDIPDREETIRQTVDPS